MSIAAIDFARLYRDHNAATWRAKPSGVWDARVKQGWRGLSHGDYAESFIARMDLTDCESLLDVGCGDGALSLPLAPRVQRISALDYSPAMLEALNVDARSQGVGNITTCLRAWEDDWDDVPECDIAIASRSMHVEDMAAALAKLNAKARLRVYLTHRVGGPTLDPEVQRVIGRHTLAPPAYIYVINILYAMGITPRLDYLDGGSSSVVSDFAELLRRTTWTLGDLSADESERLREWHAQRDSSRPLQMPGKRWAFISWEKPNR